MTSRVDRLKKLLTVQEQLKALHETRHAGHLANAASAAEEAAALAASFDRDESLSALFPEIFHRRISRALADEQTSRALAQQELLLIAGATARTNIVERNYREARRHDERQKGDRERLETIANNRQARK